MTTIPEKLTDDQKRQFEERLAARRRVEGTPEERAAWERILAAPWCSCRHLGYAEALDLAEEKKLNVEHILERDRLAEEVKARAPCIGCSILRTVHIHYGRRGVDFLRSHLRETGGG